MVFQMFFSQAAGNVTTNFLGIIIKVNNTGFSKMFKKAKQLMKGFGYTALKAQLYTAPNYALQVRIAL